jgi:hypothetical protein
MLLSTASLEIRSICLGYKRASGSEEGRASFQVLLIKKRVAETARPTS